MTASSERTTMILGVAAAAGIACGPAYLCQCDGATAVLRRSLADSELVEEIGRLDVAVAEAAAQLDALAEQVRLRSGDADAAIFEAQAQMLHDPTFRQAIASRCLRAKMNVEGAVSDAAEALIAAFEGIGDPILRDRASDLRDVTRRLLGQLIRSGAPEIGQMPPGCIVVAHELLPSVAVALEQNTIGGIVVETGGTTAHAVILARSLGIPAVIHVEGARQKIRPHDLLLVDGLAGRVFIDPSASIRGEYDQLKSDLAAHREALKDLVDLPAVTRDGVTITLAANVGKVADASVAAACHAEGIGLYRTEFAFLVHPSFPTEEQQYQVYGRAADQVRPHEVVIRVLDVGSDKLLPYFPLPLEANPSLGRRGTRLLLGHPEILRTQLRAILRLSATHTVALLFPMIGGVEEFNAAREAVEQAKAQLHQEGLAFDLHIKVGAMIETPSAAITARWIAREADFLSIGTNDLVQYLLTTDRTSMEMSAYYEPMHPAVIQTIKLVLDGAAAEGKPVSICGEMAGNAAYTALLLGLGATRLSVASGELLEIKRVIRSISMTAARQLAKRALAAGTIDEVKACLAAAARPAAAAAGITTQVAPVSAEAGWILRRRSVRRRTQCHLRPSR